MANSFLLDAPLAAGLGLAASNASGVIRFYTNGNNERMRIDASGNVGIGTTAPGALLDIGTATATLGTMRLEGNTSGYVQLQPAAAAGSWAMTLPTSAGTNGYVLSTNGSGVTSWVAAGGGGGTPAGSTKQIQFNSGGAFGANANFVWDDANARLGIGTASPAQKLDVNGVAEVMGGNELRLQNASNNNYFSIYNYAGSGQTAVSFTYNGVSKMLMDTNGNVGIGTAAPTSKLTVGTAFTLSANSGTFTTNAGSLGTTAGNELKLASIGFAANNEEHLGVYAYRVSGGSDFTTTAIGLGMDVDNTTRIGNMGLWLNANGNIGIGTTAPTTTLQVNNTTVGDSAIALFKNTNGSGGLVQVDSPGCQRAGFQISNAGTAALTMINDSCSADVGIHMGNSYGATAMYFDHTGKIGIGTTSPTNSLQIGTQNIAAATYGLQVNGAAFGEEVQINSTTGYGMVIDNFANGTTGGGGLLIRSNNNASTAMVVGWNGFTGLGLSGIASPAHLLQLNTDDAFKPNGGSWGNSSDARLKTNIVPIADALSKLTKLEGVMYDWRNPSLHGNQKRTGGFIAQQMMKIFPDFVSQADCAGADCALVGGGKEYGLSLPFTFDAYMVEAVKELKAENDALKREVDTLAAEVEALKKERP
jgi:hypothetical protein